MTYKASITLLALFLISPFALSNSAEITMSRTDLLFGANFEDEETEAWESLSTKAVRYSVFLSSFSTAP